MKQKKILFLSEEIPFNRNCGQRVRIYNVLRCLSDLYELTCVFPYRNEEDMESIRTDPDIECRKYFIKIPVGNGAVGRRLEILRRKLHLDREVGAKLETIVGGDRSRPGMGGILLSRPIHPFFQQEGNSHGLCVS
ncbi:MAG: hypothetical protein GXO94_03140 [Nitrospirae bacterium]|nr:hypothetical protein [Nitrospirota bacterium]